MCDPTTLAIASAASTAIGAAGSIAGGIGQMNAQKQQAKEVAAWQQQQKRDRDAEGLRQEDLRKQADASREAGVQQLGADQQTRQAEEEARLAAYLSGGAGSQEQTPEGGIPVSIADAELSGQQAGGGDFRSDLAAKINEATQGARQRMAALAKVSSYGDSFGGLGTTNKEILAEAGEGIDKFNEFRRGSLGAWGVEKAVDPVQVSYSNPLAGVFETAFQVGTAGLGNALGNRGAAKIFPDAPPATKFIGPSNQVPKRFNYTGAF